MTSIFQLSRQEPDEVTDDNEDKDKAYEDVFTKVKGSPEPKKQDKQKSERPLIPPVGIAKPELVEEFTNNIDNPENLKRYIDDLEAYQNETGLDTAKREVLSHAARGAESYAGFYGNAQSFMTWLTGFDPFEKEGLDEAEKITRLSDDPAFRIQRYPTTSDLRDTSKKNSGQYLEPKTDEEKASQELTGDIASMFTPGSGQMKVLSKILLPVGGQAIKQGLKSVGAEEKTQDYAKLGFMGLASVAHFGNAPRAASAALSQAENMIKKGVSFNANPTIEAFKKIKTLDWYRSGPTLSKGPALQEIKRIEEAIKNGKIDAKLAMQLRRDINEARRNMGGFDIVKPADKKAALAYIDQVDKALLTSMEQYGTNVNPSWWKQYNVANEAFRVTRRSQAISDFIEKVGGKKLASEASKILFHAVAGLGAITAPKTIGAATAVFGVSKGIQIVNRLAKSSVLRQHYLEVLDAAARGNSAATLSALEKFDKAALKEENQSKKSDKKKSPI